MIWERTEKNKEIFDNIEKISMKINDLQEQTLANKRAILDIKERSFPSEVKQQIDELILWKAKVTEMALGKTPTGRDKINKFGKRLFSAGQHTRD